MTQRMKLKSKEILSITVYITDNIFTSLCFICLLSPLRRVPSHIFPVKLGNTSERCRENYLGALGNNLKHLLELSCERTDIVNIPTPASAFW